MRPELIPIEERLKRRYPLRLFCEYETRKESGHGWTLNISSGGALVELGILPSVHSGITLHIKWPFKLDGVIPLQLMVVGRVVRHHGTAVAVKFVSTEFRTVGTRKGSLACAR